MSTPPIIRCAATERIVPLAGELERPVATPGPGVGPASAW
jgi:hypothetical protein